LDEGNLLARGAGRIPVDFKEQFAEAGIPAPLEKDLAEGGKEEAPEDPLSEDPGALSLGEPERSVRKAAPKPPEKGDREEEVGWDLDRCYSSIPA